MLGAIAKMLPQLSNNHFHRRSQVIELGFHVALSGNRLGRMVEKATNDFFRDTLRPDLAG